MKRGKRVWEKCPYCDKELLHVARHVRRYHPDLKQAQKNNLPHFIQEIDLTGEFNNMAEKLNKKSSDSDKEQKYECGSCNNKFNEKQKYCPYCGVEFE